MTCSQCEYLRREIHKAVESLGRVRRKLDVLSRPLANYRPEVLDQHLENGEVVWPKRASTCFEQLKIRTWRELTALTEDDLRACGNVGHQTLWHIKNQLAARGLMLGMRFEEEVQLEQGKGT